MSSGAKAGLAIGIIALICLIGGGIFYFLCRKKWQQHEADDEKTNFRGPQNLIRRPASVRKSSRLSAPRLSLRPMSTIFNEKQGLDQSVRVAPVFTSRDVVANPFGDHAEAKNSKSFVPAIGGVDVPKPLSIRSDKTGGRDRAGSVADSYMTSSTSSPFTPGNGSPDSTNPGGPNNVHRVHVDFVPSMDDELELRAGALVRMLHEYDDGWVSLLPPKPPHMTSRANTSPRHYASASTAPSKASSPALASPSNP